MDDHIARWLIDGPSWQRFATEAQLLGRHGDALEAAGDPAITSMVARLKDPKVGLPALKEGKVAYTSTGNAFWDLFFLADVGLSISDLGLESEAEQVLALQQADGSLVLQGGAGPRQHCIPAIMLYSLASMGLKDDRRITSFVDLMLDQQRLDGGWHCALNRAKGKRLQDTESCPMENLNILMLLGRYERFRQDPRLNGALDLLLDHWARRSEPWRPYGFGIGHQFVKLRYPEVKYGILRVLDVLSLYPHATARPEFRDLLAHVTSRSEGGRYYAESVSRSYSDFDFGQTKAPSRWITFIVNRIQQRSGRF